MYSFVRPLLFRLDAETAHRVTLAAARVIQRTALSFVRPALAFEHPVLHQKVFGIQFPNPVGLAAGADKNGRLVAFWSEIGFGFAEIGSVSALPSRGNPRPRAFRLPADRAIINRMGLNNDGADRVAARLARVRRIPGRPLGINIVKTHDPSIVGEAAVDDFRASFRMMAPFADYVTLNVSCPNTVEGRTFEDPEVLDVLLTALSDERESLTKGVRVLVKLSPPMNARVVFDSLIEEIVAVSSDHGIDGFVATNTTPDRTDLTTPAEQLQAIGAGGLSGPPLAKRSTALVSYLFRKTEGKVPIIGVGGVDSADAAYEKILAGASLVQLYTGMVYDGPGLVRSIKEGLVGHLKEDGYASISQAVGKAHVEA